MKKYNFDEITERRGTDCLKHDCIEQRFGRDDLLPLWVADMDFKTPPFIIKALQDRLKHPVFGYTYPSEGYYDSIINWVEKLHGWKLQREWLNSMPGIVKGIAHAVNSLTREGDKVIIQPPVYHPFRLVPHGLKREVVYNPLRINANGEYEMDFDHLESIIDRKCRLFILSNPHNPAGIVWKKETLQQLAKICFKYRIPVVSDEIHAEMVYPGYTHHPFPTVCDEAIACSLTFMAPSKTFNIAGVIASYAIALNQSIRRAFFGYINEAEFNEMSLFSYIATTAAYTKEGDEWRRQMIDYVHDNVMFTDAFLKEHIPQIKMYMPNASFLVWLDCRKLGLSQIELNNLIVNKAK
ncbi:MAG: PatB family C-S lyase, partial [Tannerella sp.]|nr:PatB family C-S lyase [Tannerella sp.]